MPDSICFEGAHSLFTYFYGGVNISNVGDFNRLVAYCEAQQQ